MSKVASIATQWVVKTQVELCTVSTPVIDRCWLPYNLQTTHSQQPEAVNGLRLTNNSSISSL